MLPLKLLSLFAAMFCPSWGQTAEGYTALVIMGGYDEYAISDDVEIVQIGGDQRDCRKPANLPPIPRPAPGDGANFGLRDPLGRPVSCGGFDLPDGHRECWAYDRQADSWVLSSLLNIGRYDAASVALSDQRHWAMGGHETFLSTEIFDPLTGQWGFGPDLRAEYGGSVEWEQFCAVEISPGQVVAIGGSKDYYDYETNRVELYDVETGFVRELPSMGRNRSYHACGVAQSKNGGVDIVVVGGEILDYRDEQIEDSVEIFNTLTEEWRESSFPRSVTQAVAVQFGDSFLVVGGYDKIEYDYLDSIYQWDTDSEDWILREERLSNHRERFAATFVDHDVLNCD